MASLFEVIASGPDPSHLRAAAEEALAEVDRLENQLSLFLPTSDLSAINASAAAGDVRVEPRLHALLSRARDLWRLTDGAFDIAMAPLVRAWGFFDGARADTRSAKRVSGMWHVALGDGTIRFAKAGVALDLGGIGKGYALDRAAAILRERGVVDALLHGGASTIVAIGTWPVGLADPRDPERRVGRVELRDQALSASSGLGKFFVERGRERGHILDPRTGVPARGTDAAWAITRSAADADALSTAFAVMGAEATRGFCSREPWIEAIVLPTRGRVMTTGRAVESEPRRTFGRRDFLKGAAAAAAFAVGSEAAAQDPPPAPKQKTLRLAVAGTGEQGRLLLSQLVRMSDVKVVALCDVYKPNLAKGLEIAGRIETYEDAKQLLGEEELDAIVIATPPYAHAALAVPALEAGLHVFVESPLAHATDDARAIVRAAAKSKKLVQVGHHRRFGRLYPHALKHIKASAAGNLRLIRAQWHRKTSWRLAVTDKKFAGPLNWRIYRKYSNGLLDEFASHAVDLANWYLGAPPVAVAGFGSIQDWKDGRDLPDTVNVTFEYPGGVLLSFSASLGSSYLDEHELVMGTNASILLTGQQKGLLFKEPDAVEFGWEHFAKKEMLGAARGILLDAEATKYKTHEDAEKIGADAGKADYHAELAAFLDCVRKGTPPACDAAAGLKAATPCIAAMEAIRERKVVTLGPDAYEVKE
jgi:thiamine biosynthesis lipoprotein ApbE/predicted dehydrogenase